MISRAGRSPWRRLLVAVLSVVVLFAGGNPFTDNGGHAFAREPVEALQTGATAGGWGNRVGFVDTHRLDEHFEKHGAEFGNITKQDYLHQAQLLRDAAPGGPVLQAVRTDGVTTRYDRQTGAFIAFNRNGTIRTFFKPNDGERYFRRQAERSGE
jgi:hypothetical protein